MADNVLSFFSGLSRGAGSTFPGAYEREKAARRAKQAAADKMAYEEKMTKRREDFTNSQLEKNIGARLKQLGIQQDFTKAQQDRQNTFTENQNKLNRGLTRLKVLNDKANIESMGKLRDAQAAYYGRMPHVGASGVGKIDPNKFKSSDARAMAYYLNTVIDNVIKKSYKVGTDLEGNDVIVNSTAEKVNQAAKELAPLIYKIEKLGREPRESDFTYDEEMILKKYNYLQNLFHPGEYPWNEKPDKITWPNPVTGSWGEK